MGIVRGAAPQGGTGKSRHGRGREGPATGRGRGLCRFAARNAPPIFSFSERRKRENGPCTVQKRKRHFWRLGKHFASIERRSADLIRGRKDFLLFPRFRAWFVRSGRVPAYIGRFWYLWGRQPSAGHFPSSSNHAISRPLCFSQYYLTMALGDHIKVLDDKDLRQGGKVCLGGQNGIRGGAGVVHQHLFHRADHEAGGIVPAQA